MLRDMIKDENYFNNYNAYQIERITKFENILTEKSLEENKIQQCNEYLSNYRLDLLKSKYSSGSNYDELKLIFLNYIENIKKSSKLSYNQSIDVLSLCIIFDYNDISFKDIILEKDDLIQFLFEYVINKKIIEVSACLYQEVYQEFINIIKNNDENLLINYMDKNWYKNNFNSTWYDSHNLSSLLYSGYWSFLSIAIIKILKFDINNFNNIRFVPIDIIKL